MCDVVLGVHLLRRLVNILWNFEDLTIQFSHFGKVSLNGLKCMKLLEERLSNKMRKFRKYGDLIVVDIKL